MAKKYEIFQEIRFDDSDAVKEVKRLTTVKNEQTAIAFVEDIDNVGKYGDMFIQVKANGHIGTYKDRKWRWD